MFHVPSRISRYEIKTLIGAGGMGSLYLARDTNPNTNRLVALKLLNTNLDSGDLRERFAREARALAALNHPNIVDIYDSGEFQGFPFIVMEYVRGETLSEKIKRQAPMSLAQKLKLMVELCSGLAHAHEGGIIHRDIKPANLMVDHHGRLKILDFGIARVSEGAMTRAGLQVTQVNMRIGTPGYMSPEQIEGGEIDRRSDVFAVGAVFYELLSYREAFTGANTRQIENKVLQVQPAPLVSLIPGLDPAVEEIVTKALAKDPNDRYQDAGAFEEALERQRWRLGPDDGHAQTARPTPKPTPIPSPGAGRRSRDSRADAAFHRSLAVYEEGAVDAARRFAIEALAEDPDHEDARALIDRLGANLWQPPAPSAPSLPPTSAAARTELRTSTYAEDSPSAAPTVLSTTGDPSARTSSGSRAGAPRRYGRSVQIAVIVAAVVVLVSGVIVLGLWLWPTGHVLTIVRPVGGSLSGPGINCGPQASDCTATFARDEGVELTAVPAEGYVLESFTGDCTVAGRTKMSVARSCGATFAPIPVTAKPGGPAAHVLVVAKPVGGTIIAAGGIRCGSLGTDCSTDYAEGTEVMLRAMADPEHVFRGWTGDCVATRGANGQAKMTEARTCGASFAKLPAAARGAPSASSAPLPPTPSSPASPSSGRTSTPTPRTELPLEPTAPDVTPEPKREPPPVPPNPVDVAKAEIQKMLNEYREAYGELNLPRLRRVFPQPPDALGSQLKMFKSLDYQFKGAPEFVELNPALGTATVKARAQLTPESRVGSQKPFEVNNLFLLERRNGAWVIASWKPLPLK